MKFRSAGPSDLSAVTTWITNADDCLAWAGPMVSFPIFPKKLEAQIEFAPENSFCLVENEQVVAFGQLLGKAESRYHLARLIVAPEIRGNGYGRKLCRYLIDRANRLKCELLTLNVYQENLKALNLYRKIGFKTARPADSRPLPPDIIHMRYKWPG